MNALGSDLDVKISATQSGWRFQRPDPLVSVVIPSYNAQRTIARAIQSVLEQDYQSLEIIIADDGSTDSTRQVIGQFHDPRITLVGSSLNRGAAAARNTAIRRASGAYIAFLDADDIWLPGKISTQVRIMERHPKARIATCDCLFFSIDGRPKGSFFETRTPCAGENAWRTLLAYNFISTSTVLARRTDVVELGGFSEMFPIAEDQDLWIGLATLGEVVFTPEILAYYYRQPASLSDRFQKHEAASILSMVGKHLHQQAYRLHNDEIRAIWGRRVFYIAANLYQNKEYGRSAPLFWRSVRCGFRPLKSLVNVGRAVGHGIFWRHGDLSVSVWRDGASKATIPARRSERPAMQKVS